MPHFSPCRVLTLSLLFVFSQTEAQVPYTADTGHLFADTPSSGRLNLQEETTMVLPGGNMVFRINNTLTADCPAGDVILHSQQDVDDFGTNYPNCTAIEGIVRIRGNDIRNLDGLSKVVSIGEYLEIGNSSATANPQLKNLNGLNNLESIGQNLNLYNNSGLESLDGLDQLKTIDKIFISGNHVLEDIGALVNVDVSKLSRLFIFSNQNLAVCNLSNFCAYVRAGGSVFLESNKDQCLSAQAIMDACPQPLLTLTGHADPATCGGTGSITFTTANVSDDDYTLNFKKDGGEQQAIVKVEGGEIIFPGTAGVYTDFSIVYNGSPVSNTTSVTLSDPAPDRVSYHDIIQPATCGGSGGRIFLYTSPITIIIDRQLTVSFKKDGIEDSQEVDFREVDIPALINLTAGTYSDFSYTDSKGCLVTYTGPVTLTAPPAPALTAGEVSDPTTCGGTNGSIAFTTGLPEGSYTLKFMKGDEQQSTTVTVDAQETFSLENLPAGEYRGFSITHDGCVSSDNSTKILNNPPPAVISVHRIYDPSACGKEDGQINFAGYNENIDFNSFTFYFKRNGKEESRPAAGYCGFLILSDLGAGEYTDFRFTNYDNCVVSFPGPTVLAASAPPALTAGDVTHPTTCGGTDGSIAFTTALPEGSYTLKFMKGSEEKSATVAVDAQGTFSMENLTAGEYSGFSITHNGCVSSDNSTKILTDPAPEVLTVDFTADPAVCGASDGRIHFVWTNSLVNGKTMNFKKNGVAVSATASVSADNPVLRDLAAGSYSDFSYTDENGCLVTYTGPPVVFTEKAAPTLTAGDITHPTTCGGTNGSIAFSTALSQGTYTMKFMKGNQEQRTEVTVNERGFFSLEELPAGDYSGFSIAHNGCVSTDNSRKTLSDPEPVPLVYLSYLSPSVCGGSDGELHIAPKMVLRDQPVLLRYKRDGKEESQEIAPVVGETPTLGNLSAGIYSDFSYTSPQGCTSIFAGPVILTDPLPAPATITPDSPTELCEDDQVTLTASEGASYLWSSGDTTRSITVAEGGIYSVTVTSAAACTSQAQITVTKKICNLPPVAVCKPLVVMVVNPNSCYSVVTPQDLDAGSYDPNSDWTRHSLLHTDGIFLPGTYTVTYEVMDPKGAFTTCQSEVRILDHTPPVALARGLTLELNANGQATISLADVDAGSYDNCSPVTLSLNRTAFDCSDLGNLQVRLTVTDASGNVSEALSDITISDNTPPVIQANNVTLTLDDQGKAAITTESLAGSIWDNCGIWAVSVSQNEFSCEHLGENTVTVTAEDVRGNRSTATFTVTVLDNTPPVLNARNVTLYLDRDGKAALSAAEADNGSSDNCGISTLTLDREAFDCDDLGEQTLTLTATDAAGNSSEAVFTVTVLDTLAPTVLAKDITLYLDGSGSASLMPDDIDEGSSDNCGIAIRSLQYTAFNCTNTGTQPVQYTITDGSGNSTTVNIQVSIKDTLAPEAIAQNGVVELDGNGQATLSATDIDGGSSDNCGIAEMSLSQTDFSCTDLGRRLLTLTVRDVNGNQSAARAVVEVKDPSGVCPCSYGMLAFTGIKLRHNEITAGGVGVIQDKKKVKLRHTLIDRDGTFVKAPATRFDKESESTTYIRGNAPEPEAARKNDAKDKGREKMGKGENQTLAAGHYGKVSAGKGATVTFGSGDVYVRSLKLKKDARLVFTDPTVVLVRRRVKAGKNVVVNAAGEHVNIYAGGAVKVGNGSEIRGIVHTGSRLKVQGGKDVTVMEGLFIGQKIRGGKNTQWAGGGVRCTGNDEPEPLLASRTRQAGVARPVDPLSAEDSTYLKVTLWPNPVITDLLKVVVESTASEGELVLVDLQGKILFRKTYTGRREAQEIDMRQAQPGIYILRVSGGDRVVTRRVVKERW